MAELLGLTAGVLTAAAVIPQAATTWATGGARSFSLTMLLLFTAAVALIYGLMIAARRAILPNIVTVALSAYILAVKLRDR